MTPAANTQYSQYGFQWYTKVCSPLQLFMCLDRKKVRNPILAILSNVYNH